MATGEEAAAGQIRRLFGAGTLAGLGEDELVERFARRGDPAAIEALVERHGPMVLAVCRRHLRDPDDADDAFQATFLVLARRARSLRDPGQLGPWLFGVARRVSLRARANAARRRGRERPGLDVEPVAGTSDEPDPALGPILDEELARLPEKYRRPIVLCHLEGRTQEEAALLLHWTVGSVRGRLARGREKLRARLVRRGVAPGAGLLAAVGWAEAGAASTPLALIEATANAAVLARWKGITPAIGAASAAAASLARGELAMLIAWRVGAVAALGAACLALSAGIGNGQGPEEEAPSRRAPDAELAAGREARVVPGFEGDYVIEPPDVLRIEALEALPGRPLTGERPVRPDGKVSLGFYGEIGVAGLTIPEVKEKVVLHLRKFLNDEVLGLKGYDWDGNTVALEPVGADGVFVDVVAFNSKVYHVLGDVKEPGRYTFPGKVTVLDAIQAAGGVQPRPDPLEIRLLQQKDPGPRDRPEAEAESLTIDYHSITSGLDFSTNHAVRPGDRIVVRHHPDEAAAIRKSLSDKAKGTIEALEARIEGLERKLDRVLRALGAASGDPVDRP